MILSGGVYCDKCERCIIQPKKHQNIIEERYETCATCNGEKFNELCFEIRHIGYDQWILEDEASQVWCGTKFMNPRRESCDPIIFSWEDLKRFILQKYKCDLS